MKDKMMICPKAKECSKNCFHKFKHEFEFGTCTFSGEDCPACIPVDPQPATCPDCGHPAHKGMCIKPVLINEIEYTCSCGHNRPADLQPHCTNPLISRKDSPYTCEGNCEGCDYWKSEQPTPTMPLIENPFKIGTIQERNFKRGIEAQRDADIAWHNSQVSAIAAQAVKEFAEELISLRHEFMFSDLDTRTIRAMADGGQ